MAVTLTTYPVTTESGKVYNIFAGFNAVELEFQRVDVDAFNVGSGAGAKVLITIASDITSELNIGEWLYLYAAGVTYEYNGTFKILDVVFNSPNTEITVDTDFIEVASTGYINYKQNWFLEAQLVSPDNVLVKKYPANIESDGTPSGLVGINTSMLVDALSNSILTTSGEITGSREICQVKYREVWREDDTASYTLIDDTPIVIVFTAEDSEPETFINEFSIPKIYEGYPFFINLLHSVENLSSDRIAIEFDELDINTDDITTSNPLATFNPEDYGILQVNFNDNTKAIEDNTKYIRFNAGSTDSADFETGDFNDTDFYTINTP